MNKKGNKKLLKRKENNQEIDKVIKINNNFNLQLNDLINKYELTDIEKTNLTNLTLHLNNLNKLFTNFKK